MGCLRRAAAISLFWIASLAWGASPVDALSVSVTGSLGTFGTHGAAGNPGQDGGPGGTGGDANAIALL